MRTSIIGRQVFDPCPLFFSLPKRLPALQGWNSFGEVVGKRMKRVLFRGKWSMVFENECTFSREYRQEMLYCGLYLKCSHAVHHCWRGEGNRLGLEVVQGQYPSIDASFPVTFLRFLPFFLSFLLPARPDAGSNRTFWASRDRR